MRNVNIEFICDLNKNDFNIEFCEKKKGCERYRLFSKLNFHNNVFDFFLFYYGYRIFLNVASSLSQKYFYLKYDKDKRNNKCFCMLFVVVYITRAK